MAKVLKPFVALNREWKPGEETDFADKLTARLSKEGFVDGEEKSEYPKHVGGGNYELSNGEKVKGKEAAHEAQALLDNDKK